VKEDGKVVHEGNKGPKRIDITVEDMEPLPRGRYKVKIEQTKVGLDTMRHQGKDYVVLKDLGRGRYIMKLAEGPK
jgi:hypothetical protein